MDYLLKLESFIYYRGGGRALGSKPYPKNQKKREETKEKVSEEAEKMKN